MTEKNTLEKYYKSLYDRARGQFIVFEGPDGSGKTTQANLLKQYFTDKGIKVVKTREPGGTKVGEKIRDILLEKRAGNTLMLPRTQLLLYYASRSESVHQIVSPALKEGKVVIADRFEASSFVYQVYGQGVQGSLMYELSRFVVKMENCIPDLYLILDVPVEETIARNDNTDRAGQTTIFEVQGLDFLQRIRDGYREYALGYSTASTYGPPERTEPNAVIIDGTRDVQTIHREIIDLVEFVMAEKGKGRWGVPVKEVVDYYQRKYL